MKGLRGKVALVTGGSSGIGRAIAVHLGRQRVDVAINYMGHLEGAEETKEQIEQGLDACLEGCVEAGSRPIVVKANVSREDGVTAMFRGVLDEYGRIDLLVNNAGIQVGEDTERLDVSDFDKVLAVNLRGAFLLSDGAAHGPGATGRPR